MLYYPAVMLGHV